MDLVWKLGESSIRGIHEAIPQRKRPAYTTVQTIVGRLEEKGAVRRTRRAGNANLYKPVVSRTSVCRRLVDELIHALGGSPKGLMSHLVETGRLTLEDLRELEQAADLSGQEPARKSRGGKPR